MQRRELLKSLAGVSLGLATQGLPSLASAAVKPRYLILLELNGGNDGLNMVIPYAAPEYARLRPTLGVSRDQVLQLDEKIGLNPSMKALLPIFKSGELAVVQGLGYSNPNRSHFRSIEIWDTGTDSTVVGRQGWLTRIKDASRLGANFPTDAVVIGRNPAPVSGGDLQPIVLQNIAAFAARASGVQNLTAENNTAALRHVLDVQNELHQAGQELAKTRPQAPGEFPRGPFGTDLSEAVQLLMGNPATPIVKVALPSFDTHVDQRKKHDTNLGLLADGLASLRASLQQAGIWNQTLIMTYSEFGRRARENASHGTDHGTAAPHFVMGGAVKGGVHGDYPDLARLQNDDLVMTTDYRCVYNTVLSKWWSLPDAQIDASRYQALDLIRA